METNSQYLIHYGVLGMKWGVRKDRRASRQERKQQKEASKKAAAKSTAKAYTKKYGSKEKAIEQLNKEAKVAKLKAAGQASIAAILPALAGARLATELSEDKTKISYKLMKTNNSLNLDQRKAFALLPQAAGPFSSIVSKLVSDKTSGSGGSTGLLKVVDQINSADPAAVLSNYGPLLGAACGVSAALVGVGVYKNLKRSREAKAASNSLSSKKKTSRKK